MIWLGIAVLVLLIIGSCTIQKPLTPKAEPSGQSEPGLSEENLGSVDEMPRLESQVGAQKLTDTAVDQSADEKLAPLEQQTASRAEPKPLAPVESPDVNETSSVTYDQTIDSAFALRRLCEEIGAKLGSVSEQDCLGQNLTANNGRSVRGRPIALKTYSASGPSAERPARVLMIGGLHGDEYSSVSICFRWLEFLDQDPANALNRLVVPLANPDGLLQKNSQRQNARGVDLNRNFPSRDWSRLALEQWGSRYGKNPRRYPGPHAASEPEVVWLMQQIADFQPDVIISIHAPYNLLDYDGPLTAPDKMGTLVLYQLGVFPGSLGGYAGLDLDVPVVTIELPQAGIMPTQKNIRDMWEDLVAWLHRRVVVSPVTIAASEG